LTARELTLLQITDVHLRAQPGARLLGVDTWDSLNAVLDQALAEAEPDALLVTGDIAHEPEPRAYERFGALIEERFSCPVLMLPGNHDVTGAMGASAARTRLELENWLVLALDSHVDDEPEASVEEADFQVVKNGCAEADGRHVLVATHHPPVVVDTPWLDIHRIQNGEELLEWMSEHSTVRAMVFGHAHQEIDSSHRQIRLLGTPSTCFQFAPRTEGFSIDERKPGYRWIYLDASGGVRSSVKRVEDYPLTVDLSQFRKEKSN
jgi:Icc protein